MDALQKLEIHELLSRAAYSFDEHDLETLEACFAEQATMLVNIADGRVFGPFDGREAIMALMKGTLESQTDTRRHIISNFVFENSEAEAATVISQIVLASTEHGEIKLVTSGIYRDDVRLIDGRWQITDRLLNLELGF
jgi:hypothetical protein